MPLGGLLSGLGALAGPVIGAIQGNNASNAGNAAAQQAVNAYNNIQLPNMQQAAEQLALQQYAQQGTLTPQLLQSIQEQGNALNNINVNPAYNQAQVGALNSLLQQGQGGYTPQERAALNQMMEQIGGQTQANIASIQQQAAQQGTADSGTKLAAQLQAAQAGANNMYNQGNQIAAMGNQNALAALASAGNLGGSLQQQAYGQAANAAAAQNAINQFNTLNSINQQQQNVGALNSAQQANLSAKQQLANMNTAAQQQQQYAGLQGLQQNVANQLGVAGGLVNAGKVGTSYYPGQATNASQAGTNIGAGVGGILTNLLGGKATTGTTGTNGTGDNSQQAQPTVGGSATLGVNTQMPQLQPFNQYVQS